MTTVDELLRNADIAMYVAKNSGKGRFKRFEPGMHAPVLRQMELRGELQRAIERRELVMHYQPIVALADRRSSAFEALVRWQHPEHGLILPNEFVSLAEEAGPDRRMGRWILERGVSSIRDLGGGVSPGRGPVRERQLVRAPVASRQPPRASCNG